LIPLDTRAYFGTRESKPIDLKKKLRSVEFVTLLLYGINKVTMLCHLILVKAFLTPGGPGKIKSRRLLYYKCTIRDIPLGFSDW
jgi:hypothetical protein